MGQIGKRGAVHWIRCYRDGHLSLPTCFDLRGIIGLSHSLWRLRSRRDSSCFEARVRRL